MRHFIDFLSCIEINYQKEYKKRRKYCMEMINQLAEGMEKKPKELEVINNIQIHSLGNFNFQEMIGIERD